ncbi:glycosyltransferase family 4 protein [Thalassoroseus pseudoceratinae]|uniref:glycosyltransferase family 4 protein n=1 Tax=Thalassoroseus pseudoceratinae TaxID=2713176 RepID=UPI00142196FD|nr:glycosyltransferase family 4 protein [Thalassoroseus pseudoceratinae]
MAIGSPIRVVLLADRFEVRGSSAYTLRLAQNLNTYNVAVEIVTPNADVIETELRARLPIRVFPHLQTPVWRGVVRGAVLEHLKEFKPDLIHIQSRQMLPTGNWLARHLNVPLVFTLHGYLESRERLYFDRSIKRHIICVSRSVRSELRQRTGIKDEFTSIVHTGVETPAVLDRIPVLSPQKTPVVGTACPLETVKGLPFFLGAAHAIHQVREDVMFLVAGAGPEEANLRRLVRVLDLTNHVTFVPKLHDYTTSIRAMDIFCLPSLKQGLGTIMLEAMALGKPVIATGVGGVYSVVRDEETGLVVPPSDSARLAERILELLNDPQEARRLGSAGQDLVHDEFSVEKMVRETVAVYRRILGEPNPTESQPEATPVSQA